MLGGIMDRMPLYALRAYERIYQEGKYTLITTNYRTYILDCRELSGNYMERRLQLITMKLDYPLYNIRERFTSLPQLIKTKRTKMVDKDGNIVRYKKSKFLKVEYTRVLRNDVTWNGKYRLQTRLNSDFISETPAAYIGYIRNGHSLILFETCDELKRTRKVKI